MAAGVAHFTAAEAFEAIYPPMGTWGFWPLGSGFHLLGIASEKDQERLVEGVRI